MDEKQPLRAEIADIQNSLVEGVDGVILERETSHGMHPVEAVSAVSSTISETKSLVDPDKKYDTLLSM